MTDFVDGDNWHQWRWRKPRHAAEVVDVFSGVVRTVGVLHARGVHHRDLKAENILIRRKDGRPFVIDFGTVRLPGAFTKTLGLPEGVLHLLPPELLAYTRTEAWKRGEPFLGGVAADLYALGVLLYQGLTDRHPFDPELPDKELLAAIAAVPPAAPHLLNPLVPHSLSDITLKLLEKRPEDRYPNTEALLEALEEGIYRDGPIVSRVVQREGTSPQLPGGTLLYGKLWTGPGIQNWNGMEAVLGRYTEALLPDGRKLPVCIVLGGYEGRWRKLPGSKPGAVRLFRELPVAAVRRWP
ncbi:serine/threonine protein kinase [Archangium lansingense]|uniref:serine/threonine protein kinase n=1 Tax=Archangium lansingense TaxID=2995310 RepID=UPI003B7F0B7C